MNKQRKTLIKNNINELQNIKSSIEGILFDEECYFDNMPENLQGSIRGEESEEAIDLLNEVIENLSDCISSLENIL